jgi:hypothetical protein
MQEEANRIHDYEIGGLRSKANELQMAKSASMKEKRRRAEQADQRMLARNEEKGRYASCALRNCNNDVDLYEETIECALCDWLSRKDGARSRVYYCSLAHADEDFVSYHGDDCISWLLLTCSRTSTIVRFINVVWGHIVISVCLVAHPEKQMAEYVLIVLNMESPIISAHYSALSSTW